ncbi:MAG TPA: peptide-methionine (S)-S-oxide reductase MsrA [Patescibacteria group bacterium]|nr:peptide-methionine (S)-S-oxide reductase MsrA [Patescibacteria group bacterium]
MESKLEKATFAAGCFWHVEDFFMQVPGVIETVVGYTGGKTVNPTYEMVCSHTTGHAEAVQVTFDPSKVSYEQLLKIFWENHDPTTLNRQGPDIGDNYRSAIFYHSDTQRKLAEKSLAEEQKNHKDRITTEITPASTFYKAEEYHQKYYQKHGISSCPAPQMEMN